MSTLPPGPSMKVPGAGGGVGVTLGVVLVVGVRLGSGAGVALGVVLWVGVRLGSGVGVRVGVGSLSANISGRKTSFSPVDCANAFSVAFNRVETTAAPPAVMASNFRN